MYQYVAHSVNCLHKALSAHHVVDERNMCVFELLISVITPPPPEYLIFIKSFICNTPLSSFSRKERRWESIGLFISVKRLVSNIPSKLYNFSTLLCSTPHKNIQFSPDNIVVKVTYVCPMPNRIHVPADKTN